MGAERAFLVGLELSVRAAPAAEAGDAGTIAGAWSTNESLDELALLADTAGLRVVGRDWQRRQTVDPRTYVGAGKLRDLGAAAQYAEADVMLFDDELTPSQLRNIEGALGEELRVVDRTALILDIFARHARSSEGQLQVELAQLEYRLPRLTRMWTHLARQAGGRAGGAGGGVGLRGPGETQIEVDRRQIRRRLGVLRKRIDRLSRQRRDGRSRRQQSGVPVIGLVGYTNAGKSTLMNRLTGAGVVAANRLFATLDPTTRQLDLGGGRRALLTDTVGFVRKLPHQLVAAFRATLEEANSADLLLVVADASHPYHRQQQEAVTGVLAELGAGALPKLSVLNKVDLLPADSSLRVPVADEVAVSAVTGEGIEALLTRIRERLSAAHVHVDALIPYSDGQLLGLVRSSGHIEHEEAGDEGYRVRALVPQRVAALLDGGEQR